MIYGHFDDNAREFVITDPALPWPWINYLGTEDFFSLISATAGGYCFCKDAKFRRITRYRYNSVPADDGGRDFYVNDGGTVWSPGWKPCKTPLDFYECRHGMGYTRIVGSKNGLKVSELFFVPKGFRRNPAIDAHQRVFISQGFCVVLIRGMVPVECKHRYGEFPEKPIHGRGRD
mgnify:CR=1 FL=1